jgi:hypothetical protein
MFARGESRQLRPAAGLRVSPCQPIANIVIATRIPIHLDIKILFLGSNLDDGEGSADTLDRAAVSVLIDGSVARAVLVQGNGIAFCPIALLQLAHIERQNLLCFSNYSAGVVNAA